MTVATIAPTPSLAQQRAEGSCLLIDVRTPAEFLEVHAVGAELMPLDRLDPALVREKLQGQVDRPCYVICKSGSRARQACEKLQAAGLTSVVSVDGGTEAWVAAGLPVVRGKRVMSLERQVRIAAGALVLLGVMLSLTVHPWLIGLSAFVGAGLVFAGITDTCGMGMLLARMPWNQVTTLSCPT